MGLVFFILGMTSLIQIRTIMKKDGTKTDKLERLMMRIGLFSAFYTLLTSCLIACYVYEQAGLPGWTQLWQEDICRDPYFLSKWQTPCRYPDSRIPSTARPSIYFFLLKYFSVLTVGAVSALWLFGSKTINTWKDFFCQRICCCCGRGGRAGHGQKAHV